MRKELNERLNALENRHGSPWPSYKHDADLFADYQRYRASGMVPVNAGQCRDLMEFHDEVVTQRFDKKLCHA